MERSKLKLTVIFLLVVLNLFLLGSVVLQHHQTQAYEATTRQQDPALPGKPQRLRGGGGGPPGRPPSPPRRRI